MAAQGDGGRASRPLARAPNARGGVDRGSAARLLVSVRALLNLVGQPAAQARGGGVALRAAGAQIAGALESARNGHRTSLAALSPELREVCLLKGVLYEELKALARVAREVAPAEASLFAPSMHLRSPHHEAEEPEPPSTSAQPTTPPATA